MLSLIQRRPWLAALVILLLILVSLTELAFLVFRSPRPSYFQNEQPLIRRAISELAVEQGVTTDDISGDRTAAVVQIGQVKCVVFQESDGNFGRTSSACYDARSKRVQPRWVNQSP